ncbi:MAG: SusC/RagA family TonB-linked outer membrane protein [Bacteroidetes bacterium]|nr:SusC/RagA family TonB-linked outer membrane protein [Bacteroidota bacterium]
MRKHLFHALGIVMAFLLCLDAQAQKRTITGKVIDSAGLPIPNVTVRLKSSKSGVSTQENGSFQISAGSADVLLVSNIGFESQEIRVGGQDNISILLKRSSQALNEVVVTALGIRRTRNATPYATQQITGADINKTPSSNFVDNLSGKIAGLQVTSSNAMGGSNNVILRGVKSLTQNNQALFVVDGVPYDNTNQASGKYDLGNAISDLNPDDIENMSVLKGAAASALYGSRGSNGVILITTKKGSKRKGIGVTASFGVTVGTPDKSTLPQYQEEYGQGLGGQGKDPGTPSPFFYYKPTSFSATPVVIVQTDADQATGPRYDPSLMVYNWDAFSPGDPNFGKATPWMPAKHHRPEDYFVTPVSTITSVSADGGSDKSTFRMGYTRSVDNGYLPNSSQTKSLLNFSSTFNLTDRLSLGGQINYSDIAGVGRYGYGYGGGNGTQINPMTDFRQWWQTNVDIDAQKADYFNGKLNNNWNWAQTAYLQNGPAGVVKPAYHDNLYWVRYENFETDSRTRYFGNVNLNYKITSFLSLMGRVAIDNWNQLVETRYAVGSAGTPSYGRINSSYQETNYDVLLNFDKNVGTDFNVKALLGGNIRQSVNQSINASTNGGLVVPRYYALANSVNTLTAPSETSSTKEVDGVFGGATITWKDMVTLDGTLRRDKSSTLPSGKNGYYYPAVSGSWAFSKLLDVSWLSFGKLRANYASVGGDAPVFSLQNTYTGGTPFNGSTVFSSPTTNNNPNLQPEKNHTWEVGTELAFWNNRIALDVTYYNARSDNQIMPITTSSASGYSQFYVNGGTILNKGIEATLHFMPVKTKAFMWNMDINWSRNRNKVVSLYNNQPSYIITSFQNSVQLVAEAGKSTGVLRGSGYTYLNGQPVINATTGAYTKASGLVDIGNTNADWMGGINNTFTYKNLSLSFLVDVRQGGQVYSLDLDYGASGGLTPHTAGKNSAGGDVRGSLASGGGMIFEGVNPDGKKNTTRVDMSDFSKGLFTFSSIYSETAQTYVYDASYVKLRELTLAYSLPKSIMDKFSYVKGVEVSLTGKNLWIIHKNLPYSDPEQGVANNGTAGQNGSIGFQSGAYPVFRTFGFNLKVKF